MSGILSRLLQLSRILFFIAWPCSMALVMSLVCPGEHKSMQEPGAALDGLGALLAEIEVMLSIAKSPQVR